MKRLITFSVLLTFLFGAMAFATDTRVMTMGEVNNIVMDEANISLYPSTINYYPKLFLGEFDGNDYWKVGAHLLFAEESNPFVLGLHFSDASYYHEILSGGAKTEVFADHRIDLYYGRNLGEIPFGFNFRYFGDGFKNEDTATVNNMDESLTRYEFKLGISPMEKKLDIAAGIAFTTWTDEDYVNGAYNKISEPSGNMDFMVDARYWMDPVGKYVMVPHAGFMYIKQGVDWYGLDAGNWVVTMTDEFKELMLDLGLGLNYEAAEDVVVVGDVGVVLDNLEWTTDYTDAAIDDDKETDKFLHLPYFKLGIDAKIFKWLDLRSGVWTRWERETWEPTDVLKRKWSWATTDTYLGAGFNWGRFTLDASINTDFIENGPYFISGEYETLNEQVSLKYAF